MDPNVALKEFRIAMVEYNRAVVKFDDAEEDSAEETMAFNVMRSAADRMAGFGGALDEWLTRGGFKPEGWR